MAMNRAGLMITLFAASFTVVGGMLAVAITVQVSQERVAVAQRSAEVQGREWCLGALALAPGLRLQCGAWLISRGQDRSCRARGPVGDYLILADGRSRWHEAGSR